jgi:hypothetical protein
MIVQGIGFMGMEASWPQKGSVYIQKKHDEDPLPIDAIRSATKDVEEGMFHPEREKDELTRALGNDEHPGRTRTTPGSKPWKLGFPSKRRNFPIEAIREERKGRQTAWLR